MVVCDGIGGLKEGEYASSYVTMRVRDWFYDACLKHIEKRHGWKRIERSCTRTLYDCNRYLQLYGKERGIRLGTTMTMAIVRSDRLFGNPSEDALPEGMLSGRWISGRLERIVLARYALFHVGDSRAYKVGRKCKRLTKDDSRAGNALDKCIGSFPWKGVRIRRGYLFGGEKLLLCSDGFWRRLKERELAESLWAAGRASGRAGLAESQFGKRLRKLGQAARVRGERDNQSAVVCDIRRFGMEETGREDGDGR